MRTVITLAAVAAIAAGATGTAARNAGTDAKAAGILAAARKAIGGARLDDLKAFSLQADMQRNVGNYQLNARLEMLLEMPDKYYRSEVLSGAMSGETTTGFNGDRPLRPATTAAGGGSRMIVINGAGNSVAREKLSPEEQEKADRASVRTQRIDLSHLMLGWFAAAHPATHATYTYVGEAESPDGKAHVIEATSEDGLAARLFVDDSTNLPLMVTYKGPQPRTLSRTAGSSAADMAKQLQALRSQPPVMTDYTLFFDEWQDADGIRFPMKIRRAMGGTTTEEWSVARVKVNPTIDAKKFAIEQ